MCRAGDIRVQAVSQQPSPKDDDMRRESILMIWAAGLLLAVALYLIGPDRFLDVCMAVIDGIDAVFRNLVAELGAQTYGVVRALAIAVYAVFAVLAFLASQRGQRGVWALIVVTAAFLALVSRPYALHPAPLGRWIAALALVVIAAVIMTQRLTGTPPSRDRAPPPYPPGRGP
jgi:uncharacterized membrane-anchored protein